MDKFGNTHYGMTGAAPIEGGGPRLDKSYRPNIETVETVSMIVNNSILEVDCSDEVLDEHIKRAEEILFGLFRLAQSRGRQPTYIGTPISTFEAEEKALQSEYKKHLFRRIEAH